MNIYGWHNRVVYMYNSMVVRSNSVQCILRFYRRGRVASVALSAGGARAFCKETKQDRDGFVPFVSTAQNLRADDETSALLESETEVEIRETGRTVRTRTSIFHRTNFWIEQSRPYVGKHRLTRYWHLEWLYYGNLYVPLHLVFPAIFIIGLITPTSAIFAACMLAIGAPCLLVFTQNMYVNLVSMPHVLDQPSVPNHWLKRTNTFLEISVVNYQRLFAASSEASIGLLAAEGGKIKFQVFQEAAMNIMWRCVILSTFCFLLACIMVPYCLAWFIVCLIDQRY